MVKPMSKLRTLNKSAAFELLVICLATSQLVFAASPKESEVVTLTEPGDIQQASAVDKAIVRLSNRVMECVRAKLAQDNQCFCLYPQELAELRSTYAATIKKHPEWKNKVVSYTQGDKTLAVSFGGVSRQLERKCPKHK